MKKLYTHFIALTSKQYKHCTLREKLTVYVQHHPNAIVPFLEELVNEVGRLEEELTDLRDETQHLRDFQEAVEKDD